MTVSLQAKLAALVMHCQESLSSRAHPFDRVAIAALIRDPEVLAWLAALGPALLPVMR